MSNSHKESKILLKDIIIPVDNNTTFLAHYDITANDVLYGIEPIANITTLSDGKFGGGIAIEEGTTNHTIDGNYSSYGTVAYGWDSSLNGNIAPTYWSSYNGGVPSANIGYHAHLNTSRFGFPVMEYIDKNGQFGTSLKHRWLGSSQQINSNVSSNLGWKDGTQVTYSFDMMADGIDKGINIGLYHIGADGTTNTFGSTQTTFYVNTPYQWERKSATVTLKATEWDFTKWCNLYVYGYQSRNDYEGIGWVKNVQVETKGCNTSFVNGTRDAGVLRYPADSINPYEGTISLWYKPNYSSSYVTAQADSPKLFQAGDYYGNSSITLWNFNNSFTVYMKGSSDTGWSGNKSVGSLFTQNQWTMISITWKDKNWNIYSNGKLVGSFTASQGLGPMASNVMHVGGDGGNGGGSAGRVANGIIDEFRIDKVERSAEEIESWYISNQPFYPKGIYRLAY